MERYRGISTHFDFLVSFRSVLDPSPFVDSHLLSRVFPLLIGDSSVEPRANSSDDSPGRNHLLYGCLLTLLGIALTLQIFLKPDFYGNWLISIALIPVAFVSGAYGVVQILQCLE
jgi:hypothetical protein